MQSKYTHGLIYEVQLDKIVPKYGDKYYCPLELEALTESIQNHGLLQPILVTSTISGLLQIIDGDQRWHAAQNTTLKLIEVRYIGKDTEIIGFTANMLRTDIHPIQKAELMLDLKIKFHYSHEDLAQLIGRSVPTISEILALNNLTVKIRQMCRDNRMISHSALLKIAKIKDKQEMENAFFRLQQKMMVVGGHERNVAIDNNEKKVKKLIKTIIAVESEFAAIEQDELSPLLQFELKCALRKLAAFCKRNTID